MFAAPTRRLRRVEASRYLEETHGVTRAPSTLARLACVGGGPSFAKVNNIPLYAPTDLDSWVRERMTAVVASTSQLPARRAI